MLRQPCLQPDPEPPTRRLLLRWHLQEDVPPSRQVRNVGPSLRERPGNLLARLDPPELDQPVSGFRERARDDGSGFGFTFGADDGGLPFLLGLRAKR